jgi:tRNA-Thr(GGU) m(6)t(6)A37 methyltransferase TsaA
MIMTAIQLKPIGIIHSPFKHVKGMPIQPSSAEGIEGWVEIFAPYTAGLQDLDGFSHIILLYHFHEVKETRLVVIPFLDKQSHGIFATRAPTRPNPIGLSIVELKRIENEKMYISNVDILDGTPLLDIKPYVPGFDDQQNARVGWLHAREDEIRTKVSDDRFEASSKTKHS